jgi:thiamine-phosphate pyrophosphorylase
VRAATDPGDGDNLAGVPSGAALRWLEGPNRSRPDPVSGAAAAREAGAESRGRRPLFSAFSTSQAPSLIEPGAPERPDPASQAAPPHGDGTATLPQDSAAIRRLLDANLDRAREGLRVLEDWSRFALDRSDLVTACKDLRQRLGRLHHARYKFERDTSGDTGAGLGHPAQLERREPAQVLAANAGRVQEALRVLEEFGRLEDPQLATEAAAIRYRLYDLEVELLRATATSGARRETGTVPQPGGATAAVAGVVKAEGDSDGLRERLQACQLYLITRPVADLERVVAAALDAGVRLVQYRAKEADDRSRLAEAQALRQLCARHGALFLVNDRIDLALAVDADGVHLGQDDLPPELARRLLGPRKLIGRSTHSIEQLRQAEADGCDYLGVGPVNATPTKPGRTPVGLAYVRQAAAESRIPWFAIGGIESSSLTAVLEAGATRVAVVRAITDASDPAAAAAELLTALEQTAGAGPDAEPTKPERPEG